MTKSSITVFGGANYMTKTTYDSDADGKISPAQLNISTSHYLSGGSTVTEINQSNFFDPVYNKSDGISINSSQIATTTLEYILGMPQPNNSYFIDNVVFTGTAINATMVNNGSVEGSLPICRFETVGEYITGNWSKTVFMNTIRMESHCPFGNAHDGNGRFKISAYNTTWTDIWTNIPVRTSAGWVANTTFNTICSKFKVTATTIDLRSEQTDLNYLREIEVNY